MCNFTHTWIKFCIGVDIHAVVTNTNFGNNQLSSYSVARCQILGFSTDLHHYPYNITTLSHNRASQWYVNMK